MASFFITGNCRIKNRKVSSHNGQQEFSGDTLSEFLENAYSSLKMDYPKFYKMDTLSKLGVLGSEITVSDKDLKQYPSSSVAVVLANKNASLDTDLAFHHSISKIASPALFVYTLPNIVIGEICIRNKWRGENAFFIEESFDIDFQAEYVDSLLQQRNVQACLAGWVDVLGEDHDVFLYLVEKVNRVNSRPYSKEELRKLFT